MLQALRLSFLIILLSPALSYAAKKKERMLCVNPAGTILLKKKCKKTETKFTNEALVNRIFQNLQFVGIKGGTGITGETGPVGPSGAVGPVGPAGVKGPKGLIDFSGCRKVTAGPSFSFGSPNVTVTVSCSENAEFLFADSFTQMSFGTAQNRAIVKTRLGNENTIAGDTREFEVTYVADRITTDAQGELYSFQVQGFCCPR